ncbi:hypothetical protein AQUCO_00100898v1 [Aquilegia coerulea]|uniref:Uncharacterized protein n=1 Tax=Aquilegia coerulea TaxID=218851 RepID=A0A2G5FCK7_AQUCA|nr:hypothetical protein AQUCO_00100898v1 [Aquilegia coerulea]
MAKKSTGEEAEPDEEVDVGVDNFDVMYDTEQEAKQDEEVDVRMDDFEVMNDTEQEAKPDEEVVVRMDDYEVKKDSERKNKDTKTIMKKEKSTLPSRQQPERKGKVAINSYIRNLRQRNEGLENKKKRKVTGEEGEETLLMIKNKKVQFAQGTENEQTCLKMRNWNETALEDLIEKKNKKKRLQKI